MRFEFCLFFFFFQAEDGIRDLTVTGVQTCALPIFTALAAGGYALLRLAEWRDHRAAAAAGLLSFYAGGALLAAVQLFVGFQAMAETIRSQALPVQFAASFNFPPVNLFTFAAPGLFGDVRSEEHV